MKNIIKKLLNPFNKANKELPHIVGFKGGLGNQMFQYAFGLAVQKRTGRRVIFDKTIYDKPNKRKYELGFLNLDIEFLENDAEVKQKFINEQNPFAYEEGLFAYKEAMDYHGYFQNEKYLAGIENQVRKAFTFPKIPKGDEFNSEVLRMVKKTKNPVFIHLRRDDYLTNNWVLPLSYYQDAVKYVKERVDNPVFFVLGIKCEDYIKSELDIGEDYIVLDEVNFRNKEDWKDMYLMTKFKHCIIANSTFSWWGAWLGDPAKNRVIVAPSPFVCGSDEIVCDSWIKLKR